MKVRTEGWRRNAHRRDKTLDTVVWAPCPPNQDGEILCGTPISKRGKETAKYRLVIIAELGESKSPISFHHSDMEDPYTYQASANTHSYSVWLIGLQKAYFNRILRRLGAPPFARPTRRWYEIATEFETIEGAKSYAQEWWKAIKGFGSKYLCHEHQDCIASSSRESVF